ncbi:MFS transporter [Adlercreutzia sp. R25]|uniref:MFS transporter n=1 Tax=Adlercreutzia shanghongiae TaxID=3111773 RepID=UPI002DB59411|nr:MFS transporter [Adlercreutzia sp. R25]MEC4271639.1 MFS transporter [Adlercreutzia sp. R25]
MASRSSTTAALAPLFAAGFLAYAYNNIFMTLTPTFVVGLGGALAEAGLQNSLFLAAAVLLRFVAGPVADRWGTKPVMAVGLIAFVIGGALFPFCSTFWHVVAVRVVQAVGLAGFWSSATTTVSDVAPAEGRGWWLGLYRLVTSVSLLIGPTIAFALVEAVGFNVCFGLLSLCAAVALLCVLLLRSGRLVDGRVDERCAAMPDVADEERPSALSAVDGRRASAPSGLGVFCEGECATRDGEPFSSGTHPAISAAPSAPRASKLRGAASRWAHDARAIPASVIASVLGGTFIAAAGYGLLFSFGATFASAAGAADNAGWYFTLVGIGGLAANPIAGFLSDRIGSQRLFGAHLLLMGMGIALFSMAGVAAVAFVASGLLAGFGYAGATVCAQAQAASRVDQAHRATILALQQNAIDLGIASASAVYGIVFTALGPESALPFIVQALFVLAAGTFLLRRH